MDSELLTPKEIRAKLGCPWSAWAERHGFNESTISKTVHRWWNREESAYGHSPTDLSLTILVLLSKQIGQPVSPSLSLSVIDSHWEKIRKNYDLQTAA